MTATTAHPIFRSVALFILLLVPSAASAQIPQFDAFYVFGDSLADNGNIFIQTDRMGLEPPAPPSETPHRMYFEGRFSNGYVGVEYLWQRVSGHRVGSSRGLKPFLALPSIQNPSAINFAFGGTGTPNVDLTPGGFPAPGLKGQVELFRSALNGKRPSSHALYVISTGANDYRDDPFNEPMDPVDVIRNIEEAIASLYRLGARNMMVVDLPDLGKVPSNAVDPDASMAATALSHDHNRLLYRAMRRLQRQYPRLHLITVKLDPLFTDLERRRGMDAHRPLIAEYFDGLPYPYPMEACLFIHPSACVDADPILFNGRFGSIFWDIVHPTTEAHHFLGDYMYRKLEAEYDDDDED